MNDERLVIVAIVAAGGIHLAGRVAEGKRDPENIRIIMGTFILVALLLLIAEFWPQGARGLAVVIFVTSLVMNGTAFFKLVNSLVKG